MLELTEDVINRAKENNVSWNYLSQWYDLTEDFIRQYKDRFDWAEISYWQELSEEFVIEFQDKIPFYCFIKSKNLQKCSKSTQIIILNSLLDDIKYNKEYYFVYMTDYMKEQYEKLSIML